MEMNQTGLKRIIRIGIALVAVFLLVRLCSNGLGGIIKLPGGSGEASREESGGGLIPREQSGGMTVNQSVEDAVNDVEREWSREKYEGKTPSSTTPSTIPSASSPLVFKGIPMTGSLSAFCSELAKAGFRSAGSGTYTGDFAGYNGCKVTPSGSDPVREVRVDFPVISDWDALEKAYDSLQASLTQKYGIEPKVNGNVAVFDLPNGTITLDAEVRDRSAWHVILKYANALTTIARSPIDDL